MSSAEILLNILSDKKTYHIYHVVSYRTNWIPNKSYDNFNSKSLKLIIIHWDGACE